MKLALSRAVVAAGLVGAVAAGIAAWLIEGPYGTRRQFDPRVRRIYDRQGHLTLVVFDSDGDLKLDTWSYMDGERLAHMDVDADEDGAIDRREHYGPGEVLERIEFLDRAGHVTRTEWYKDGLVVGSRSPTDSP